MKKPKTRVKVKYNIENKRLVSESTENAIDYGVKRFWSNLSHSDKMNLYDNYNEAQRTLGIVPAEEIEMQKMFQEHLKQKVKDLIKTNDLKYVTTKLINTAAKQLLHSRAYYSQDIVSIENLISGVKNTPGLWEEFRRINRHQKVSLNEFRFLTKDELKKYGTQFNITDSTRTLIYESKTHNRRILISFTYDPNTGGTIPIMERIYD